MSYFSFQNLANNDDAAINRKGGLDVQARRAEEQEQTQKGEVQHTTDDTSTFYAITGTMHENVSAESFGTKSKLHVHEKSLVKSNIQKKKDKKTVMSIFCLGYNLCMIRLMT